MPTLYGLIAWLPWTAALEITSALAVVLFLWWFCRRTSDLGLAGAAAAACGLLLAHHAYANDCVLLIPLLLLTVQRAEAPAWLKLWRPLLAPAPVALLASPAPLPGQLLVAGFVAAGLIGLFFRVQGPVLTAISQSVTLGMGTEGGKDRRLQNADSSAG